MPTNKSKFRTVRRLVRVLWQNDAPVTQNTRCEGTNLPEGGISTNLGKFHIYKITKNGYCEDKQCKDGGLPKNMKTLMPDYKYREAKASAAAAEALAAGSIRQKADHCTRSHFLPFKNRDGKLYNSVVSKNGNLGGFTLSKENPLFLAVILKEGKLNAHTLLYLKQPSLSTHSGALTTNEFKEDSEKVEDPRQTPTSAHRVFLCTPEQQKAVAAVSCGIYCDKIWEPLLKDFNGVERVTQQPERRGGNVSNYRRDFR